VTRCDSERCWCSTPPVRRRIQSTGVRYTVEELQAEGAVRVFRYQYLEDAA
jgi:hypothetical protein